MITRWGACYLGELKDEMVYPISGFDNQCRLAKLDFLVGQIRCKKLATQELDATLDSERSFEKRVFCVAHFSWYDVTIFLSQR